MRAIILSAGKARRLYPLCNNKPKCLLPIDDEPLIAHTVAALRGAGVQDISVVTGHYGERVEAALGAEISYVRNPYFSATADLVSLWCARKVMSGAFLYMHGDLLFRPDLLKLVVDCAHEARVAVESKDCDAEDEKVRIEGGLIREIGKEVSEAAAQGEFIGIAVFSPGAAAIFRDCVVELVEKEGRVEDQCTSAVQRLIDRGHPVRAVDVDGASWMEVDFLADYDQACEVAHRFVGASDAG